VAVTSIPREANIKIHSIQLRCERTITSVSTFDHKAGNRHTFSPIMPAVEYKVSHVTSKEDFPGIVRVERVAFTDWQAMNLMMPPNPSTPENFACTVRNHEKAWSTNPNAKYLKAELPDGKIIGMAKWHLFLDPASTENPWDVELPPTANLGLYNQYFGDIQAARVKWLGGKRHILMAILAVDPEYQRMGVGHELLRWGLELADEEQVETWIDASAAGYGLYKQFGWEEVGKVYLDLAPWGGDSKVRSVASMIRQPKAKK
jgi:GNAT superfamily N-acetyltransferase